MKKLTPQEQAAVDYLAHHGPLCPGDAINSESGQIIKAVFDSLVKKKRATVEMTDDGPRYALSAAGRADAQA